MKIEYFDNGLIGISFKEGYRISLNINNINISKSDIINFLSEQFGEGYIEDNNIIADKWYLTDQNDQIILVLKTENHVNQLKELLKTDTNIDYKSLSSFYKIKENLKPFVGKRNTQKNRDRIREIIRKTLYIKPYDFTLSVSNKGFDIVFKIANFEGD